MNHRALGYIDRPHAAASHRSTSCKCLCVGVSCKCLCVGVDTARLVKHVVGPVELNSDRWSQHAASHVTSLSLGLSVEYIYVYSQSKLTTIVPGHNIALQNDLGGKGHIC
jgi:hypothetical protein